MRTCQYCGTKVPDNAKFCATCGATFENEATTKTIPEKPTSQAKFNFSWVKQLPKWLLPAVIALFVLCTVALTIFLNRQPQRLQRALGQTTYSLSVANVQNEKKPIYFLLGQHENQAYYVNNKKSAQQKVFYSGLQSSYHFDNHSLMIMTSTKDNAIALTIYLKDLHKTSTGFVAQGRILGHTTSDTFNTTTYQTVHLKAVK